MTRLAVVTSHPIQYQAPWFRALARVTDLTVFFCHRQDPQAQADAGFGEPFEWDVPLLEGYRSVWLVNRSSKPGVSNFRGCDTPEVDRLLAAGQFDACVVNGWYLKSYVQAMHACRKHGIPLLVRGDSHLLEPRRWWWSALKYLPYRWMLGLADAHLYVGEANRDYLRHYGVREDRLVFAPHFVDNERFALEAASARTNGAAARLRSSWGASADDRVFLFAGKLIARKRVQDFVRAVDLASRQDPRVRGVVVGSGPEEKALKDLASQLDAPVHFHGFVNQAGLPACYAAADSMVLPSATESWGLVINEAMASGIPVIVSDEVGCAWDLVDHGKTGFIYQTGNLDRLSNCVRELVAKLDADQGSVAEHVRARIERYSCHHAVAAVLRAVDRADTLSRRASGRRSEGDDRSRRALSRRRTGVDAGVGGVSPPDSRVTIVVRVV